MEEVEAIYELGDSNGDNVLDLGEFIAIMFPAAGEALAKLREEDTTESPGFKTACTANSKQVFPEEEMRGLSPNFLNNVSAKRFIFPRIGLTIFCCRKIGGPILGIYKSLTGHMHVEIVTEAAQFFSGNT